MPKKQTFVFKAFDELSDIKRKFKSIDHARNIIFTDEAIKYQDDDSVSHDRIQWHLEDEYTLKCTVEYDNLKDWYPGIKKLEDEHNYYRLDSEYSLTPTMYLHGCWELTQESDHLF